MLLGVYSVRDAKLEGFLQHQCFPSKGVAIRAFTEAVNTPESPFNKNPEDYALFYFGTFDDLNGKFDLLAQPQSLVTGFDVVKSE